MSRAAVLRAAGAYADEVAWHLGLLTLKAAVLAGLRIQDGNKYAPDERLIPQHPAALLDRLRGAWQEYEGLGRALGAYLEDRHRIPIRLEQMAATHSWNDALPLALVAAELRLDDPLAAVTLAANFLRGGVLERADQVLHSAEMVAFRESHVIRVNRNRAGLADCEGDRDKALHFAWLAGVPASVSVCAQPSPESGSCSPCSGSNGFVPKPKRWNRLHATPLVLQ